MNIKYRVPALDEIEKLSEQIVISYTAAYKRQMCQKYLSSLPANHWVLILHESIQNGYTCLIAVQNGRIVGSTVFSKVNERAIRFYLSHGFIKANTFTIQENDMMLSCDKMVKIFE